MAYPMKYVGIFSIVLIKLEQFALFSKGRGKKAGEATDSNHS